MNKNEVIENVYNNIADNWGDIVDRLYNPYGGTTYLLLSDDGEMYPYSGTGGDEFKEIALFSVGRNWYDFRCDCDECQLNHKSVEELEEKYMEKFGEFKNWKDITIAESKELSPALAESTSIVNEYPQGGESFDTLGDVSEYCNKEYNIKDCPEDDLEEIERTLDEYKDEIFEIWNENGEIKLLFGGDK